MCRVKHNNNNNNKPEQHAGKAQNQGTTENSHTERCTHVLESTDVNVQNIQHGK
jgi:hypothetical protein